MICKRCALIGVHRLFFCIFLLHWKNKRKPNGNLSEGKRSLIRTFFWIFPEKKIEKACLYEKEFLSLHPLNSNRVDPLAQLVEHNTFNVGVLGSSPKRITNKVAISRCNLFSLKKTREILETMTRRDIVTAPSPNCHSTTKSRQMLRRSPFVAMRSSVVPDLLHASPTA